MTLITVSKKPRKFSSNRLPGNSFKLLLLTFLIFSLSGCMDRNYNSNSFLRKNPIRDCEGKVPVDRRREKIEFGRHISPSKNISLLSPIVVFKARQRGPIDSAYLAKTTLIIKDSIENQFITSEWVDKLIPKTYDLENEDSDRLKDMMFIYKQDTVDYSSWFVAESFLTTNNEGYSLLMVLDGIIGFDGAEVRDRYFWRPEEIGPYRHSELTGNHLLFFLIDNKSKKITFADHYVFHCDIRIHNSLKKVLEYAYLQLLNVRFEEI